MAKVKTLYVCRECGGTTAKWLGKCPHCGSWNTLEEEVVAKTKSNTATIVSVKVDELKTLQQIAAHEMPRIKTGIGELDRALGGGIVPGSLFLLGGEPGIGKSTLVLQAADGIGRDGNTVLYASGEESEMQIKLRAERMQLDMEGIYILAETELGLILEYARQLKPKLLIIDSIQTMCHREIEAAAGSVSQVREGTARLLRFAKETNISIVIVGHVTKEGNIAGPKMLEHMVDAVLYFEGERSYNFRVLRVMKNRFGSASETGIFEMEGQGLKEVKNPSAYLLAERNGEQSGSSVAACMDGMRALLVEIQALTSYTKMTMPRRTAIGYDYNRLIMLLAVLEKRLGLRLSEQDVYVNVLGGVRIIEPAADLAIALAILSSGRDILLDPHMVVMGEISLTGDIRRIPKASLRIKEAEKMGFTKFIVPQGNKGELEKQFPHVTIYGVRHLVDVIPLAFKKKKE